MKISILIYGRDAHLLETRKWVLQSRGYRVTTIPSLADIDLLPLAPAFELIILCHTLPEKEAEVATALASSDGPQSSTSS
jgi:DNA-binding response OmpR family regulator